jgi:formylglycine-generating enzyme required for sulfatase activity
MMGRGTRFGRRAPATACLLLVVLVAPMAAAAQPAGSAAREFRDCADCPVMVPIGPGSFIRGSTEAEARRENTPERDAANERPQGRVTIGYRFAVGKFEVTRGQFAQYARDARLVPGKDCLSWDRAGARWGRFPGERSWQSPGFEQADDHPVVCVNWPEAEGFAAWLARRTGKPYRLLTDAEWEYVARAGTVTTRFWGEDRARACEFGNVSDLTKAEALHPGDAAAIGDRERHFACRDGFVYTAPVGRFKANPWGLHDLFGNAWEWTADCFARSYAGAPTDGSARAPAGGAGQPCAERVMRGGAWHADAFYIRAAKHDFAPLLLRSARMGLRVARALD